MLELEIFYFFKNFQFSFIDNETLYLKSFYALYEMILIDHVAWEVQVQSEYMWHCNLKIWSEEQF